MPAHTNDADTDTDNDTDNDTDTDNDSDNDIEIYSKTQPGEADMYGYSKKS